MRWSEKLLLGSTMIRASRGIFYSPTVINGGEKIFYGCALGMISAAESGLHREHKEQLWLFNEGTGKEMKNTELTSEQLLPCQCYFGGLCNLARDVQTMVIHIFDCHICWEQTLLETQCVFKPWTIEQLADWLEIVQPKEICDATVELTDSERPAEVICG